MVIAAEHWTSPSRNADSQIEAASHIALARSFLWYTWTFLQQPSCKHHRLKKMQDWDWSIKAAGCSAQEIDLRAWTSSMVSSPAPPPIAPAQPDQTGSQLQEADD